MATLYVRNFSFKDSLSDDEVLEQWRLLTGEATQAIENVEGVRSVKWYSGAGALRAQIRAAIDMDDAAAYERLLVDPTVSKLLGRVYGAWDLNTATQTFLREVTSELIAALSSTG